MDKNDDNLWIVAYQFIFLFVVCAFPFLILFGIITEFQDARAHRNTVMMFCEENQKQIRCRMFERNALTREEINNFGRQIKEVEK